MKAKVSFDYLSEEWLVKADGKTYFSTKSWTEAIDYALVLYKFFKDSQRIY